MCLTVGVHHAVTRPFPPPSQLYAVAYRPTQATDAQRLEVWPEALTVGAALPTMPLWLSEVLCLPLTLEKSYQATCAALRIRV